MRICTIQFSTFTCSTVRARAWIKIDLTRGSYPQQEAVITTYKNIQHYSSDDYIEALRSTLLVLATNVLIPAMIANEEI